jgi:peptidoglycan/xylan/chitin deacetylase (PgdA/CDA1 family)
MKLVLSLLLVAFFAGNFYADDRVYVLCYHTFLGKQYQTDFSPENFLLQVQSIKELGYHFVGFDDIQAGNVHGETNVLITIDDGNHSIRKIYRSVLISNQIKPLLFIYPAIISKMYFALTWQDLKEYTQDGATIGCHGYNHMYCNEKFFKKDREGFYREIYKGKYRLEQMLSTNMIVFGYPFGSFSPVTIDNLQIAGFQYAFSLRHDYLKIPLSKNANPYDLPRYMVTKSSWKSIFDMLKRNGYIAKRNGKKKPYENS